MRRRLTPNLFVVVALLLISALSACDSAPKLQHITDDALDSAQARWEINLNQNWRFHRGAIDVAPPSFSADSIKQDDKWQLVSLPHTWNHSDGEDGGGDYFRGDGWYIKELLVAETVKQKRFYLEFDGANTVTDVWLNGEFIGQHIGGYSRFRFDISQHLQFGVSNTLAVRVNNDYSRDIAPISGDWTFYGGLYRDVSLLITEPVHIETMKSASDGVFISPRKVNREHAEFDVEVLLSNQTGEDVQPTVVATVLAADGTEVTQASAVQSVRQHSGSRWYHTFDLAAPRLWQGRRDPYLYTLQVDLQVNGMLVDRVQQPLGLRYFRVDPQRGFYLNGEPYDLHGVGLHQGRAEVGWASSDANIREDFELLSELGVTSLRLAHYQHDEYVYQLADEYGIVLWTELGMTNEVGASPAFDHSAEQQLTELILQRYNHPSIAFWGIFNEITMRAGADPLPLVQKLNQLAQDLDPARATTGAALGKVVASDNPIWKVPELIAGNVYFGWYYDQLDDLSGWAQQVHGDNPGRSIGVSEYGAGASELLHAANPYAQDHSEEYQSLFHEASWLAMRDKPQLWGKYLWVGFDFASDMRDEGVEPGVNNKGLITADRRLKKDAFFFYKSHWNPEPLLHITSRRFDVRYRDVTAVKVYANRGPVELVVNGKSLGEKALNDTHILVWDEVKLRLGKNTVKAIVKSDGTELRDEVSWTLERNSDTALTSQLAGIDYVTNELFNLPYGLRLSALSDVLQLPFDASWELVDAVEADPVLAPGSVLRVVAANGDSRDYQVVTGPLSRSRPASANRELSKGVLGYPDGKASNANDGITSIDEDKLRELNLWMTADPANTSGWWKVDLGAEYYIDDVQIDWLPRSLTPEATVQYTIDIAPETGRGFEVIGEEFEVVVDRSENTERHQVRDTIGRVARHIRVSLIDSDYKVDISLMGEFTLVGMSEFTANGGLIFSSSVDIDYLQRSLTLPASLSSKQLLEQIAAVAGVRLSVLDSLGQPVVEAEPLADGATLIAEQAAKKLKEAYRINLP